VELWGKNLMGGSPTYPSFALSVDPFILVWEIVSSVDMHIATNIIARLKYRQVSNMREKNRA
jgi:hypothetical protein